MNNNELHQLFVDELNNMYDGERQILKALPKIIQKVSCPELKEALARHLKETEKQLERIEKIFSMLGIKATEQTCEGLKGIIEEGEKTVEKLTQSPGRDAAIISTCQKVEHYEIASYGTLKSYAKQLDLDSKIINLLDNTLDEEGAADKKLTKLAEGSFLAEGINKEAAGSKKSKW